MPTSPWTFEGESTEVCGDESVTLVDGTSFVVSHRSGTMPGAGAYGLFMLDTRVLSVWRLRINGALIQPLSVAPNGPFSAAFAGRVDDAAAIDAPLAVIQRRHVGSGMREDLELRNHGIRRRTLRIELVAAADFGGVFDVKAGQAGKQPGVDPHRRGGSAHPCAIGVSSRRHDHRLLGAFGQTRPRTLVWEREFEAGEQWSNCFLVSVVVAGRAIETSYQCGQPVEKAIPVSRLRQWRDRVSVIDTDNVALAQAVNRASEDLHLPRRSVGHRGYQHQGSDRHHSDRERPRCSRGSDGHAPSRALGKLRIGNSSDDSEAGDSEPVSSRAGRKSGDR